MRIIGNIEHPFYKISVFKSGEKTIIQIEDGQFEQLYKFNDGEAVSDLTSATTFVSQSFLQNVDAIFNSMVKNKVHTSNQLVENLKIDFPEII
ncbi:MAG TPA: hypothetical protein PKD85_11675 [Saprospiraceae bacterium]|nr:hypothetical protein [Saprospiraceae bacterium]